MLVCWASVTFVLSPVNNCEELLSYRAKVTNSKTVCEIIYSSELFALLCVIVKSAGRIKRDGTNKWTWFSMSS
jgi:hypothetical protein